ncbi:hypothetical protein L7F22_020748 [Adiantum nelumboides]|nr:hypothetical protein [Adiantum nelumboides]
MAGSQNKTSLLANGTATGDGGLLLCNCSVIQLEEPGSEPVVNKGVHILVRNKVIEYMGPTPVIPSQVIDVGGRYVLPGLCDAHVHVTAVTADLHELTQFPPSLVIARATKVLRKMLLRGFTTVRDVGGCDWGLAKAVEEGSISGPRILFSGSALSQTGGHGDFRLPSEDQLCGCSCSRSSVNLGRVCDGVPEVRKAARDELRKGASQLKIMVSGGVASPTDHVKNLQFSAEEISAVVEEAENVGAYVCAHAYTAASVKRALELGVRSIEHGNFVDNQCLDLMKSNGAFLVPTLVTYDCICRHGEVAGMPKAIVNKVADLLECGIQALALAEDKGVNICFGTDLLGAMHDYQLEEFKLRSKVLSAASILRSATSTCAKLFCLEGKVGVIAVGAYGDLLVLEKNPLIGIHSMLDPDNITMILKEGEIVSSKTLIPRVLDTGCIIKHFEGGRSAQQLLQPSA